MSRIVVTTLVVPSPQGTFLPLTARLKSSLRWVYGGGNGREYEHLQSSLQSGQSEPGLCPDQDANQKARIRSTGSGRL